MVNGTVSSGSGLFVELDALILGGTISGYDFFGVNSTHPRPQVNNLDPFLVPSFVVGGTLNFGSPDQIFPTLVMDDFILSSPINIDRFELFVVGELVLSGPTVHLNNSAAIIINDGGVLTIGAPTEIISQQKEIEEVSSFIFSFSF